MKVTSRRNPLTSIHFMRGKTTVMASKRRMRSSCQFTRELSTETGPRGPEQHHPRPQTIMCPLPIIISSLECLLVREPRSASILPKVCRKNRSRSSEAKTHFSWSKSSLSLRCLQQIFGLNPDNISSRDKSLYFSPSSPESS